MKRLLSITLIMACVGMGGCAQDHLRAPCPNFGASCPQLPVNSWDYTSSQSTGDS